MCVLWRHRLMRRRDWPLSRRRVLAMGSVAGLGTLAGCSGIDAITGDGPQPEPESVPDPLEGDLDIDTLRDRTAQALSEEVFTVTGSASATEDGTITDSQAKVGRGDPDAELGRYLSASSRTTELTEPSDADAVYERFYNGEEVYSRRVRDGNPEFGRDEADYDAFIEELERDLTALYEVGTSFTFGDPTWDRERGGYIIEAVEVDDEITEAIDIERCQLVVNADGVVTSISAALSVEETEQIQAEVDGEIDPDTAVEEPAWMDKVDANLPLWSVRVGEDPSTTVGDEQVVVSSDAVVALNRTNGTQQWELPIEWEDDSLTNTTSHTVAGETVYVGTNETDVYALDRADGTEQWTNTVPERLPQPTVVGDIVVFVGLTGVYAFHAEDGSEAWTWQTEGNIVGQLFHDGRLFVGDSDGIVAALDVATGAERWQITPSRSWVSPSVVSQSQLFAGAFEGAVYSVNTEDGSIEWRRSTPDTTVSVSHADGTVYVGDRTGRVAALNADTGTERWTFTTGDSARVHPRGDRVYVASHDGSLSQLTAADGNERWTFETGGWVEHLAITETGIYVGSRDSHLYALETDTGDQRWRREVNFWVRTQPTIRDEVVYATDLGRASGIVYAFDTHPES